MQNDELEKIFYRSAEILIEIGSINFNTKNKFKLTSGKLSPVYCDCRRIISFPKERKILTNFACDIITKKVPKKYLKNISGGETAGIPFSSFISSALELPMTYIRKEKKKFGKKSQIEGVLNKKDYVILVEDLITDGGSKLEFLKALENKGALVKAIFVIFNYGIHLNYFNYNGNKINLIYLTSWKYVLDVVKKKKILKDNELLVVFNFLKNLNDSIVKS